MTFRCNQKHIIIAVIPTTENSKPYCTPPWKSNITNIIKYYIEGRYDMRSFGIDLLRNQQTTSFFTKIQWKTEIEFQICVWIFVNFPLKIILGHVLGTNELYNASMNMRALALCVECVVNCQRLHEECKDDVDVWLANISELANILWVHVENYVSHQICLETIINIHLYFEY